MPDITMCAGEGCPIKEDCYRFTAKPNGLYQSYFSVVPYDRKLGCDHYWENRSARVPLNNARNDVAL